MREGAGAMSAERGGARVAPTTGFVVLLVAGLAVGCTGSGEAPAEPHYIHHYIESATGVAGTVFGYTSDPLPVPSGLGPTLTSNHTGNAVCANGGSVPLVISASSPISQIGIWVEDSGVAGAFVDRWLHATYGAPIVSDILAVTLPREVTAANWNMKMSARDSTGIWGPAVTIPFTVRLVAGGDVQVHMHWDSGGDMDLRVVDPTGFRLAPETPQSPTNGVHDLASNEDCVIDGTQNENVGWGVAPLGNYTVELLMDAACEATGTVFVTTVRRKGFAPQITIGSMPGAIGPVVVDTFTY